MKARRCFTLAIFVLLASLAISCEATPSTSPTAAPPEKADARPEWQKTWDKLLGEARREGKVVIYYGGPAEVREDLSRAFREKHGIELEFVAGRSAELPPKLERERRAGLYLADVGLLGFASWVNTLEAMNITDPIEPFLILPEVKDTSKWFAGRLPLVDEKGHAFAIIMAVGQNTVINSGLVKKGEISGARDFLNSKWKEKIVMIDPTTLGPGSNWYQHILLNVLGMEGGRAYMRELAKNIDVLTRDYRQMSDWVARGKYAIGIATRADEPVAFIRAGAPVEFLVTSEPRLTSFVWGLLNMFKDRPHPSATQVFLNWLFSREGLSVVARSAQLPVTRVDVSVEGLNPALLPQPNDGYQSREMLLRSNEMIKLAQEDFARFFQ